jgi:hypothetical protein
LPAVLALLKARLLVVPDVISLALTCTNVGVAAAAASTLGSATPRRAHTRTSTPRRPGRRG